MLSAGEMPGTSSRGVMHDPQNPFRTKQIDFLTAWTVHQSRLTGLGRHSLDL